MIADHGQVPLLLMLSELRADYPGWVFQIQHRYDGPHLEAYRPQATSGLYAVITADLAEMRLELNSATR